MRGKWVANLLIVVVAIAGLVAIPAITGQAVVQIVKSSSVPSVPAASPSVERFDDGVDVGAGAVAMNPYDTPTSAYRMQTGARAGKLQAVFFVCPAERCENVRAAVAGLAQAGWTVEPDGMIAFADAKAHRDLLARATGGETVPLPYVVIFRDGVALRRFDASNIRTADQLGTMLNQQAGIVRCGFK